MSVDGDKQQLMKRYTHFREFVKIESDSGGKRSTEELAKHFEKKQNGKNRQLPSKKLECYFPAKTHQDLINEIKNRKQAKTQSTKS